MARESVKRFYEKHPDERRRIRQANYAQTQGGPNNGEPWTSREIERILAPDRPIDRELSKELGRSVQSIQIKRYRCGGAESRQQ